MAFGNTVKDGSGTAYWLLVDAAGRLIITDNWAPSLESDVTANDSDKSLTVPANTEWKVLWVWVKLVTTATVGDRQLVVQIQDDGAVVIAEVRAGIIQAESLTRYYLFGMVTELEAFRDTDILSTLMPEWYLPASYVVRVYDATAVDAAADDMDVHAMTEIRSLV